MSTALQGTTLFPNQGLDLQRPKHLVPATMSTEGYDFIVEDNSRLCKRDGYEPVNDTQIAGSGRVGLLETLSLSNGTTYQLVQTGGSLLIDNNGIITATAMSEKDTTYPWDYAQFLDKAIIVNGSSFPMTWDGSVSATISAAPSGAISCAIHLNQLYLFIRGTSQFSYSAIGDINTYTGANTDDVNVEQNNGQNIVGGRTFARNELVIFKERSMFKWVGTSKSNFNLLAVDTSVGCSCIRACKTFKTSTQGGLMVFPYTDGIYVYDGTTPKKISSYIQTFWDTLNYTRFEWMNAIVDVDNGRYILTVPEGSNSYNSKMIVVDLNHPWTDENGLHMPIYIWRIEAESMNVEYSSSTQKQKIVFGSDNGYKYEFTTSTSDNGVDIESYFVTPLMTFNDGIGNENCLRRIYAQYKANTGSLEFYYGVEDSDDYTLIDSVNLAGDFSGSAIGITFTIGISAIGAPANSFSSRINTNARGRRIKLKISQTSADDTYTINSPIELYFKGGGQRA